MGVELVVDEAMVVAYVLWQLIGNWKDLGRESMGS